MYRICFLPFFNKNNPRSHDVITGGNDNNLQVLRSNNNSSNNDISSRGFYDESNKPPSYQAEIEHQGGATCSNRDNNEEKLPTYDEIQLKLTSPSTSILASNTDEVATTNVIANESSVEENTVVTNETTNANS